MYNAFEKACFACCTNVVVLTLLDFFLLVSSFTRETPRRFKKEVLMPYTVNGSVDIDALNKLLTNIGHSEDCLSEKEQLEFLAAAGCSGRSIPLPKLAELIN